MPLFFHLLLPSRFPPAGLFSLLFLNGLARDIVLMDIVATCFARGPGVSFYGLSSFLCVLGGWIELHVMSVVAIKMVLM